LLQPIKGFEFNRIDHLSHASTVEEAIGITISNYMHHQLGWSLAACEDRVAVESSRQIPKGVFDSLEGLGWNLEGARLLDLGSGQGAAVLEALERGADAYGVEPGDEFRTLSRMRLRDAGHNPDRISAASGEALPFSADSFDYVISLQVLEHVPDPYFLMKEMFRVLKPGGECYIRCENYLSFREQHYRVAWLPMLPKRIGRLYLWSIGRNPSFLVNYIYYTTYPQIWSLARRLGFQNLTYHPILNRIRTPASIRRYPVRMMIRSLQVLPSSARQGVVNTLLHLNAFWRVGVRVRLQKPVKP
jgi:SAM-dependent methyltransferase